jgi:hypothetical protein
MKATTNPQPKDANSQFYKNEAIEYLESLSTERGIWEKTLYQTATVALYGLLGKVYAFYETSFINRASEERLALRQELADKQKWLRLSEQFYPKR